MRFVGAKQCGPATRKLEEGACAVQLYDHAHFWLAQLLGGFLVSVGRCPAGDRVGYRGVGGQCAV